MTSFSFFRTVRAARTGSLGILAGAAVGLVSPPALADGADTLNFSAGLTRQHDGNLFRLPDGINPLALTGKSARADTITTATLGINFKKAWSLQQVEASYEHVDNRYATYGYLDNEADNARAAWRWQFTPRLKGNLTYDRSQALVSFGDFTDYGTKNVRTNTAQRFDADWTPFDNGWHLLAGIGRHRTSNSQLFVQEEGSRSVSADFGLRYVFPSGNWIGVVARDGEGEFFGRRLDAVNQLDTGFRDRRRELRAYWSRGKTLLEGSLGHASRDYDHFSSRDYSGGIGSLKWTWTPTGKLAVLTSWKRDFTAYTDARSSYYRQDIVSIGPVWQAAAKLRLSLKLDHTRRDYRGAVTALPFVAREDRGNAVQISADWSPLRALTVTGYYIDDRRDSSLAGSDYAARILGLSLHFEL